MGLTAGLDVLTEKKKKKKKKKKRRRRSFNYTGILTLDSLARSLFVIIIITTTTTTTYLLTYLLQFSCHSVAVVLTLVQTKQIRINVHKRNNTKTQYKQYKTQ